MDDMPEDVAAIVLTHCRWSAARAARTCPKLARAARQSRLRRADAMQIRARLARDAARRGDVAELEDVRTQLGFVDHRTALVAAAHARWDVVAWCVEHAVAPINCVDARLVALHARRAGGLVVPWGPGVQVWSEVPKVHMTRQELRAELASHPRAARLDDSNESLSSLLRLGAHKLERAVGVRATLRFSRLSYVQIVPKVCDVMTDVRSVDPAYTARLCSRGHVWANEVPLTALRDCVISFVPVDETAAVSSSPPDEQEIEFCAWGRPEPTGASFVCGGVAIDLGEIERLPRHHWNFK